MFIDQSPLYITPQAPDLSAEVTAAEMLLVLPGSETDYTDEDRQVLQRMMSALSVPESAYAIVYVPAGTSCHLSALPALEGVRRVINMGVEWPRLGFHLQLAAYHAVRAGNWILVGADGPAKLSKDSMLKKQLWEQLMRMHQLATG